MNRLSEHPVFRTLEEHVFETLKAGIVLRRYNAGQEFTLSELEAIMGVSRTPIRQALRRLTSLGFVTMLPHASMRIKALSAKEAVELYTIRLPLETMAIARSVEFLNDDDIGLLRAKLEWSEMAYTKRDVSAIIQSNREFHGVLYSKCDMPRLLDIIHNLNELSERYRLVELESGGQNDGIQEHRLLLKAASERDAEQAERLTRQHLLGAMATVDSVLGQAENRDGFQWGS